LLRRSQLFVPGGDEAKIRKSVSLECDSIVFDLEDSVPVHEKENARKMITSMLKELPWEEGKKKELCVRINALEDPSSARDIEEFGKNEKIASFLVPKCEHSLTEFRKKTEKNLIPLIETSRGFLSLEDIVRSEGVVAVAFGAADFANSVRGRTAAYQDNTYLKTAIALTASAYGVDPIDCVFFNLKDIEGFRNEASRARDLGYRGKQVIHPFQIPVANEIFSPSKEDVELAKKVIKLYENLAETGKGALSLDGELVDAVHYRWAKSLVENLD
jgi:citrate lyase subunit beta / citryl-CoA lyase